MWSYFLGNVLVGVKVIFLPNYPLVLSIFKHRDVRAFLSKKKMKNSNRRSPLNNSVYIYI